MKEVTAEQRIADVKAAVESFIGVYQRLSGLIDSKEAGVKYLSQALGDFWFLHHLVTGKLDGTKQDPRGEQDDQVQ